MRAVQTGFDSAAFLRFLAPRADSWLTQTLHETTPRQHHHDFTNSSEPDSLVTILTSLSSQSSCIPEETCLRLLHMNYRLMTCAILLSAARLSPTSASLSCLSTNYLVCTCSNPASSRVKQSPFRRPWPLRKLRLDPASGSTKG